MKNVVHPGDGQTAGAATRDPQPALPRKGPAWILEQSIAHWREIAAEVEDKPVTLKNLTDTAFERGQASAFRVCADSAERCLRFAGLLSDGALGRQDEAPAKPSGTNP